MGDEADTQRRLANLGAHGRVLQALDRDKRQAREKFSTTEHIRRRKVIAPWLNHTPLGWWASKDEAQRFTMEQVGFRIQFWNKYKIWWSQKIKKLVGPEVMQGILP